jgi:hypothetical protein
MVDTHSEGKARAERHWGRRLRARPGAGAEGEGGHEKGDATQLPRS